MRQPMEQAKRDEIKATLLTYAQSIVETDGFQQLSIRKLAKRAGYTEGSIYNYFENKQALVRALIARGFGELMEGVIVPVQEEVSIEQQLRGMFCRYALNSYQFHTYYMAVMLSEDPEIKRVTTIFDETPSKGLEYLIHMFNIGVTRGEFNQVDTTEVAQLVWASVFGLILKVIVEGTFDEDWMTGKVNRQLDLLLSYLRKDG
ncbi:TetR family transcriptional regulator [Halolactibacillus miurensis]|uniref:DNA-binding transcriptional regulator, AcrR family n=1 Tax=Halolactibacillus miurensis TaxID=306541 RepID=A0A1I6UC78_9BACI|nr:MULTISPECIES: TetR/AcrR family transcriptional regulator [Halolactibacillus]GEM05678.1 TetR family transcriptional regulator [Halolactibacillus miurensis]SFS99045.1 DNA-binding transcriptional regulator, AcrR family [Halolactibacillus miurensis]